MFRRSPPSPVLPLRQADDEVANESTFDAIHDTEAFVAANDDVVIATFRGSKGGRDWLTNLSILPRDVPEEWNLDTEDGDLHRVGTRTSLKRPQFSLLLSELSKDNSSRPSGRYRTRCTSIILQTW